MGESTDYSLLLIVGVVGVVAIIAMGISATKSTNFSSENLVGQATISIGALNDYTGDGIVDSADADALADIIAYGDCPASAVCDINNDGTIDEQDLALLNQHIPVDVSAPEPAKKPSSGVHKSPVISSVPTALA